MRALCWMGVAVAVAMVALASSGCSSCQSSGPAGAACKDRPTCPHGQLRVCINQCKTIVGQGQECEPDYCKAGGNVCDGDAKLACQSDGHGKATCQPAFAVCDPDKPQTGNNLCYAGTYCKPLGENKCPAPVGFGDQKGICAGWFEEGQSCDGDWSQVQTVPVPAKCAVCEPGTTCARSDDGKSHICRRTCDPNDKGSYCPCGNYACLATGDKNYCDACASTGSDCPDGKRCCDEAKPGTQFYATCSDGKCCRKAGLACSSTGECCSGAVCSGGKCTTCGGNVHGAGGFEPCCPGEHPCVSGLGCTNTHVCAGIGLGDGAACTSDHTCLTTDLYCGNDNFCHACGIAGNPCCKSGSPCRVAGLTCQIDGRCGQSGSGGGSASCGHNNEPCCTSGAKCPGSTSAQPLYCNQASKCAQCGVPNSNVGSPGEECCPVNQLTFECVQGGGCYCARNVSCHNGQAGAYCTVY